MLNIHQSPVMRPAQIGRKSTIDASLLDRQCHGIQNATLGVAFSGRPEFATCDVANLRDPIGINRVKGSKVAQIGGRKTAAVFMVQLGRKLFYYLLAVFGPLISALNFLYDFQRRNLV